MIEPYEKTLNKMPIAERKAWVERVRDRLGEHLGEVRQVAFLAGTQYREFLTDQLRDSGIQVEVPMEGLSFGRQLHWLKNHTREPPR